MNTELTAKQIARIERIRAERAERIVDQRDCICKSEREPHFLCMDHQCCWKCSTQKGLIHLNRDSRLWLCDGCNDMGDWCRGCRNLIDEEGMCSPSCDYYTYEGSWKCERCDTWREDEKYCANCGPEDCDEDE